MTHALIIDAIRTPIGRYGGVLASVRADDLGAIPIKALLQRNPTLDPALLDDVIYGCANQAGEDNRNVARMSALLAGLPVSVPGTTINRLCGSGMDAIGTSARAIRAGEAQLMLAGGVESMSRAPLVMPKAESAFSRNAQIFDTTIGWRFVNPTLHAQYGTDSMPETAENVAAQFNILREDQDIFAWGSQQKTAKAIQNKRFSQEIVSVEIPQRKGSSKLVEHDEHPRPDTTLEQLAKLPTHFRQNGSVTAGNASGVNDGACALLLASEDAAKQYHLTPRARVIGMATAGVEPRLMGIGPVPATRKVLAQTGLTLAQMDIIELNEAFAAQALAVLRELKLDPTDPRINPNGGAIALGHPLAATGVRLVVTVARQLRGMGERWGVALACIGGGQGIAVLVENPQAGTSQ